MGLWPFPFLPLFTNVVEEEAFSEVRMQHPA
jgi:hypothetical protein